MKKCIWLLSLAAFMHNPTLKCGEVITLFLKPYPAVSDINHAQELNDSLKTPDGIHHHTMYGILQKDKTSGIFATYAGYLHISDTNGQLTFPRKQEKTVFHIVITTRITPNVMAGNTLHHWEFETGTPTGFYKVEKKKDAETGLYYWDTQKIPELPKNMVIPMDSIVIFAKPKYIYVPTGITVTNNGPNIVLPSIYVKKGIKILSSTLYVLNIKQYFSQVEEMEKRNPTNYTELILPDYAKN